MSEFKGTPGPWSVEANTSVDSELDGFICEAYGDSTSFDEDKANAILIAASPELLEALQEMVKSYQYEASMENPSLLKARAAIAKALGQ